MKTAIVTRPEPGLAATLAAGRALGLPMLGAAMTAIVPRAWDVPDPANFDAVLAGSANAFRHGGEGLVGLASLPVLAVGEATAQAARDAGFAVERTGSGGLQNVLDTLEHPRRLLRLAGEDRVTLHPPEGTSLAERVVYAAELRPLSDSLGDAVRGSVVLLHSARSAQHFAAECARLGIARSEVALACLGPRIAAAAGPGWAQVASAPRPEDGALLELARELCQT